MLIVNVYTTLSHLDMSDPNATPVGSTVMPSSSPPSSKAVNPSLEELSFEQGRIVMLSIPTKLRQSTKPIKLPCRVISKVKKVYSLATSIN